MLRYKRNGGWEELTYAEFVERTKSVTIALYSLGIRKGDHVALFADNSKEWAEIYFGIVCLGASAIPIDSKLQEQEVAHILHDSEATAIFSTARRYSIIRDLENRLPRLKCVVLVNGEKVIPTEQKKVTYRDYDPLLEEASENIVDEKNAFNRFSPEEDDVASLIYTSGTTGRPKGAMLSHKNFVSDVVSCREAFKEVTTDDNFLLVLPLHHAFAFTTCLLFPIHLGCSISMVESLKTIAENMAETHPSVLIGVPLLIEKMLAKIELGIQKKTSARFMMKCGMGRMVGSKILERLGGKLRVVICGGAPCDAQVIHGWARLGLIVREGYGLTEAAPVVALNPFERNKPGTVGKALPNIQIQILHANENGVGEIAVKGDNVMLGYYKNKQATQEVIQGGWLLTGDLGSFDKEGYLTISGRKKSLIVNREGKNIYPEEVETQILQSPYIAEALVLGYREPHENTGEKVGVIVVPDQEAIQEKKTHISDSELEELVRKEVRAHTKMISNYKRPRCIQIRYEEFSKTSTQKIKRYLYAIDTSKM